MDRNSHRGSENDSRYNREQRRLYKDPDRAKLCGVCAGLADYFDLETWVVRLITVSFFLFSNGTAVIAYFVACFILDPKPGAKSKKGLFVKSKKADNEMNINEKHYDASVKDVWRKGKSPTETLSIAEGLFDKLEGKLQNIETYVTSKQYQLKKEFDNIG
jgi:phage shock protein C